MTTNEAYVYALNCALSKAPSYVIYHAELKEDMTKQGYTGQDYELVKYWLSYPEKLFKAYYESRWKL